MSDSKIEWTDTTWNPVRGCTKVSPGCAHCYAETFAERFRGVKGHPYEQGFDLRLVPHKLAEPLSWKKPRRVFVNSMSDLFQDGVPDSFIDQVFATMTLTQKHTFQVLTKRADRMRLYLADTETRERISDAIARGGRAGEYWVRSDHANALLGQAIAGKAADHPHGLPVWPLRNVWLGPSVENQAMANQRFPIAAELGEAGWCVMVSMEPLLSAVSIPDRFLRLGSRSWVIVGGESGHDARPFDIAWARSIVKQCADAKVSCFVKQLGAVPVNAILGPVNPVNLRAVGAIKDRKGGDMTEWPEDLRVREFPR